MQRLGSPIEAATGVLSCGLVAALVVSALSLSSGQARVFFLGLLVLIAVGVCLAVPVQTLPTLALVVIVVIPDRIADYTVSPLVTPSTVILAIWAVRRLLLRSMTKQLPTPGAGPDHRLRQWICSAAVILSVVMVLLVVVSPSKRLSIAWTLTFVVAVAVPLLIGDFGPEAEQLGRALPWLGTLTAAYAIVQSLLEQNLVYTPIYDALGLDELQHWAVYRSDSSLGHPLTAGMFFAIVLAYCTGRWLQTQRLRFGIAALINGIGIVTTVSRGSYAAAALAVAGVLLLALGTDRIHRIRHALVLALLVPAAFLALNSDAFVERGLSAEGLSSVNSRTALPQIAIDTARSTHWLGGGPANSLAVASPYNFQHLPIENSYLQLLIGVGAPGLVLFLLILVLALVVAFRRRNFAAFGALLAYATAISGFAALDSRRNLLVLLGVLVLLSLYGPDLRPSARPVGTNRPARRAAPATPVGSRPDRLVGRTAMSSAPRRDERRVRGLARVVEPTRSGPGGR